MSNLAVNTNITLGEQQIEALDMIKNFILEKKEPAWLYYGSAGTGKSILVNFLIDWCEENNIRLIRIPYTEYDNLTLEYLLSFFPELSSSEIEK